MCFIVLHVGWLVGRKKTSKELNQKQLLKKNSICRKCGVSGRGLKQYGVGVNIFSFHMDRKLLLWRSVSEVEVEPENLYWQNCTKLRKWFTIWEKKRDSLIHNPPCF